MEIIETIPIYNPPEWPKIVIVIGIISAIVTVIVLRDTDIIGPIMSIFSIIAILGGLIVLGCLNKSEFKHNEYIVRITDISTQEFIENYEVTKRFDYSDVIQVKEIEKK